jgi:hypothetical protein
MARTAVPYSTALINGSLADPAGTSIASGAGNGGQIPATTLGGAFPEQTFLRVVATTAGNAVIKAGSLPLAIASGQGDLTIAVGTSATVWIGPLESGRFLQNDGSLIVETTQTMVVTAFRVPRH